jgi:hypothetical protein
MNTNSPRIAGPGVDAVCMRRSVGECLCDASRGTSPELRTVIDGLDLRAPNRVGRHVLAHGHRFGRSCRSSKVGCSRQEGVDIQAEVPPELQMPLVDSGSLIAKPRVTEIRMGTGSGRINGHL